MKLNANFFGTRRGEEAERFSFKNEGGVGGVVNDDQMVLLCELDDAAEEFRGGARARGIVGIIQDQRFGFL